MRGVVLGQLDPLYLPLLAQPAAPLRASAAQVRSGETVSLRYVVGSSGRSAGLERVTAPLDQLAWCATLVTSPWFPTQARVSA